MTVRMYSFLLKQRNYLRIPLELHICEPNRGGIASDSSGGCVEWPQVAMGTVGLAPSTPERQQQMGTSAHAK